MKLAKKDVQPRLSIKLDKSIKFGGGVMKFGEKDDYPNIIESVVSSSVTAKACADIYSRFISGGGFEDKTINDIVVGTDSRGKELKMIDLLRLFSHSVSYYSGLWVHMRTNAEGLIKDPTLFDFRYCRFTKIDDKEYTPTMAYNNTFGTKGYKGKYSIEYSIFNSNEEVVQAQIKEAGGPDKYKGQVYFQFWDNRYIYPLSLFDSVYLDADTEWQVELFKNRELRNNFMLRYLLRVAEFESEEDKQDFLNTLLGSEGADGTRISVLEDEFDTTTGAIKSSGAFQLDKIDSNIQDKLFENWEQSISNKIRKAVKALPKVLIDYETSQLGTTSGEAIIQAVAFFNGMVSEDRELMERTFSEIFSKHKDEKIRKIKNWKIKPFSLTEDKEEVVELGADAKNAEAQATLRGSVGGVTALIALQQSVSQGFSTKESAIATLEVIYGLSNIDAVRLIGDPVKTETPKT